MKLQKRRLKAQLCLIDVEVKFLKLPKRNYKVRIDLYIMKINSKNMIVELDNVVETA